MQIRMMDRGRDGRVGGLCSVLGSREFSTRARWAGRVDTFALVRKMSESCAAAVSVSVESSTAGEHLEDEQGRCVNGSMDGAVCLEGEDAGSGGSPLCVATTSLRVGVELRLLSGDGVIRKTLPGHRDCQILRRVAVDARLVSHTDEFDVIIDGGVVKKDDSRILRDFLRDGSSDISGHVVLRSDHKFELGRNDACTMLLWKIAKC